MSAVSWAAWMALRIRVRKSAIGSVMASFEGVLPAALGHPGDEAAVGQLPQADPAQAELAVDGARAAAAAAPTVLAGLVLGGAGLAHPLGGLGHGLLSGRRVAREGHAEGLEQRLGLLVRPRGRRDGDVQPAHLVDRVVVDLREDDLLAHAHRVVAAAVEGLARQPAEVADARDGDRHEPIEELVGALGAQRDGQPDGHALAQLERGDRLAGAPDVRLLAGDRRQLLGRSLEHARVLLGLAHAHVERDLLDARDLHDARVAEALHERGADLLEVARLQASGGGSFGGYGTQSIWVPERRATRTRLPSSARVVPIRVGFLVLGSTSATLETWTGPSRSMTPACALGFIADGRWWRLTMLTPSTNTRSRLGSVRRTLPVLPLSLPERTTTSSSRRIF